MESGATGKTTLILIDRRRLSHCYADFLRGTLAPFFRASDRPIAIACFRLFTVPPFPPGPELSVPFFSLRIALATVLPAAFPYLRPPDFRCAMFDLPKGLEDLTVPEVGIIDPSPHLEFREEKVLSRDVTGVVPSRWRPAQTE